MQVTMTGRKSFLYDNFRLCQLGNLTTSFSSLFSLSFARGSGVMFLGNFTFHVKNTHTQSNTIDNSDRTTGVLGKLFYAEFIL